ncbi:hypothetical protein ACJJTC_011406 [Scirpophaga incertulas]
MKIVREFKIFTLFLIGCDLFIYLIEARPQEPEINDQFYKTTSYQNLNNVTESTTLLDEKEIRAFSSNTSEQLQTDDSIVSTEIIPYKSNTKIKVKEPDVNERDATLIERIYSLVMKPIIHFTEIPKVNSVLRNIGVCLVNGAMELIAYYLPLPIIPLIASVAGTVIPFEPVVMLRKRMPVTSYRRAFRKAINSFMGTFDKFRLDDDEEDDPYMTRRFNRRLANNSAEKTRTLELSEKNKINSYDT